MEIAEIDQKGFNKVSRFQTKNCKGFIAIHNMSLGNPTGGSRFLKYSTEKDALKDALNLGEAMTYKFGFTNLSLGGGKAVIMDLGKDPVKAMQEYGQVLNEINSILKKEYNKYFITGEDVGITEDHISQILKTAQPKYIVGTKKGSGSPSIPTAYYVKECIKVCSLRKYGTPSLKDLKVAVQGAGKAGEELIKLLLKEKAHVIASEINEDRLKSLKKKYPDVTFYGAEESALIFKEECNIFAPCALGEVINKELVNSIKFDIICGSANNPIVSKEVETQLHEKGILYAPDFCVNAAGAICVGIESLCNEQDKSYDKIFAQNELSQITIRLNHLFDLSEKMDISPAQIAREIVDSKLKLLSNLKGHGGKFNER